MKNYLLIAFTFLLFHFSFLHSLLAQCDSASFSIDAIAPLGNDQYEIQLTFCAPAGFNAVYFYQNTGAFAFFLDGATLLGYPDSISSTVTGATYYGYSLFTDTVLYFENHYPSYWGYADQWWVCNDGNCGSPQSYCTSITLQTQGLPEAITLKGISGGGNPAAGCPMTIRSDCFYNPLALQVAGNSSVVLGTDHTCTELNADITNGSGDYSYLWCTGETSSAINPCPEESRTYHLQVEDNQTGCTAQATLEVEVSDIRCGSSLDKVRICYNNRSYCVKPRRANRLINKKGATLGECASSNFRLNPTAPTPLLPLFEVEAYQSGSQLSIDILSDEKAQVELVLISMDGKRYEAPRPFWIKEYQDNEISLPIAQLPTGVYLLNIYARNQWIHTEKLLIR